VIKIEKFINDQFEHKYMNRYMGTSKRSMIELGFIDATFAGPEMLNLMKNETNGLNSSYSIPNQCPIVDSIFEENYDNARKRALAKSEQDKTEPIVLEARIEEEKGWYWPDKLIIIYPANSVHVTKIHDC
jgi:hypothetical protein